jgi:hypothetical protein
MRWEQLNADSRQRLIRAKLLRKVPDRTRCLSSDPARKITATLVPNSRRPPGIRFLRVRRSILTSGDPRRTGRSAPNRGSSIVTINPRFSGRARHLTVLGRRSPRKRRRSLPPRTFRHEPRAGFWAADFYFSGFGVKWFSGLLGRLVKDQARWANQRITAPRFADHRPPKAPRCSTRQRHRRADPLPLESSREAAKSRGKSTRSPRVVARTRPSGRTRKAILTCKLRKTPAASILRRAPAKLVSSKEALDWPYTE